MCGIGKLVFQPITGRSTPVSLMGVIIVKFTHAIARVLKGIKVCAGRGATFGAGVTAPFVASLPAARSGDIHRWVEAAATGGSLPPRGSHRASAAFTMAAAVSWVSAHTASLIDGGRRIKNIERKRSLSGDTLGGRCCLSFPMRTLGLRPCISMGRRSNSK